MVEIQTKVTRIGDSYGIIIPKALIKCKVLSMGQEVTATIKAEDPLFRFLTPVLNLFYKIKNTRS